MGSNHHHCKKNYYVDAVEVQSCIDIVAKFTDEQYTTINQSTAGHSTRGSKHPAVD